MIDFYDVMAILGLIILGAGLWWMWPPLALVVVGTMILIGGVVGAKRGRSE